MNRVSPLAFIPSPTRNGFYLGPFFFHAYGIMYVLAVAAAIYISRRRWAKAGGDPDLVYEVAKWGFPAGLIGGRIYFLITTPSQVPDHWWGPFAIWDGGLGIWGGIAAGVAAGLWVLYRRLPREQVRVFMDAATPGLLVAQAIGRVGNYFNQELFGKPTTVPWGLEDRAAVSGRPLHAVRDLPAHVPLRDHLGPVAGRRFSSGSGITAGSARPACSRCTSPATRAFRIFEETLRIDYSRVHPRDAAELLDRGDRHDRRAALVHRDPAARRDSAAAQARPTAGYSRSATRSSHARRAVATPKRATSKPTGPVGVAVDHDRHSGRGRRPRVDARSGRGGRGSR